ncbi:hypothetical protein EDB89DRAFT_1911163 [Lactarius sanguifluus]|nr:hypothetical protein EDB89DRAFT_1911163 [Lactarius sanguifluus]
MTWHAGLRVAVVSGWVDSRGVLRAAGRRGGGAGWRVAGLRSLVRALSGWRAGIEARRAASGVAMSERRKTKEKQLNEVGSRAGGVGGNASGLANRVGSAVVSSRPKPSSSSSTGVLCVATAWYPGVGAFARWSDGGELEAKDGGGGYGMMCGEAAAVTWLCKRKLVHAVATDVHFKKKKKLIWLVVTRLVTIVVAVGIVGDEMHEVAPLENSPPSGAPGHQAVATRKTPVDDDELDHVTAAATSPPRHTYPAASPHPPDPCHPNRTTPPSRRQATHKRRHPNTAAGCHDATSTRRDPNRPLAGLLLTRPLDATSTRRARHRQQQRR